MSNMLGKSGEPWTHGCCNACAKDSKYKPRRQTIRQGRAREKRHLLDDHEHELNAKSPFSPWGPECPMIDMRYPDECNLSGRFC